MFEQVLKAENVRVEPGASRWEDAVRLSLQPLVDGGHVEPRYADGVIENTREYGPYYIIAPGLAFVHGRPDQGVLTLQMAVTVLRKAVDFAPDQSVRLLVALAAPDSESHLGVLRSLALLFKDQNRIDGIVDADSPADACARLMGLY